MSDSPSSSVSGWQLILAVIGLVVLVGYLYIQNKSAIDNHTKKSPLELFGVPSVSSTPTPSGILP